MAAKSPSKWQSFAQNVLSFLLGASALVIILGFLGIPNIRFPNPLTPSRVSPTATPAFGFTYKWRLNADCSDSQGAAWQQTNPPYAPLAIECAGDSMAMTADKQCDPADSKDLCADYTLSSLPDNTPFGHSFNVSVNVSLDASPDSIHVNCAQVHLKYSNDNSSIFRVCSDGAGNVLSFMLPATSTCGSHESTLGDPIFFSHGGTQYGITIEVRGTQYVMIVTQADQTKEAKEVKVSNYCFSSDVGSIVLDSDTVITHSGVHPSIVFSAFAYQKVQTNTDTN